MTAVFTYHAADAMQRLVDEQGDSADLRALLEVLDSAKSLQDVRAFYPSIVSIGRNDDGDVFVAQAGAVQVMVANDPESPERMVVVSVFRSGDTGASFRPAKHRDREGLTAEMI